MNRLGIIILLPLLVYFVACSIGIISLDKVTTNINYTINVLVVLWYLSMMISRKVREFSLKVITIKSIKNAIKSIFKM